MEDYKGSHKNSIRLRTNLLTIKGTVTISPKQFPSFSICKNCLNLYKASVHLIILI